MMWSTKSKAFWLSTVTKNRGSIVRYFASGSFHSRFDNVINDSFNHTVTRHRWNCQELKYRILRSALIHVLAHFQ
jgi:hypothetical protein